MWRSRNWKSKEAKTVEQRASLTIAVIQPLVGGLVRPTKPKPTVTTARTVVEPRPVRAGVSWPVSVFIWRHCVNKGSGAGAVAKKIVSPARRKPMKT